MALVTVGNTHIGDYYKDPSDDGEDGGDGCLLLISHYFKEGTYGSKITLYYYNWNPINPMYGFEPFNVIPIVFDEQFETLNNEAIELEISYCSEGWYSQEISLNREIESGETCYVGIYGQPYYSRWDKNSNTDTLCYWTIDAFEEVTDHLDYVRSGELGYSVDVDNAFVPYGDRDYSMYFTYYDAPLSENYYRGVNSEAKIFSINKRDCRFTRLSLNDLPIKAKSIISRTILRYSVGKIFTQDRNKFSMLFARSVYCKNNIDSIERNVCIYKRKNNVNFNLVDKIQRLKIIVCYAISSVFLAATPCRFINYIRLQKQKAKYKAENKHLGKYFRNSKSNSRTRAVAISSRLLNRFCSSNNSFWDFIRGKIRETPNVITLFCPIDLEVEIESKI